MESSEIINAVRQPVVQGRFYPANEEAILASFSQMMKKNQYPVPEIADSNVFGAILPHAGHMYSGWQTVPLLLGLKNSGFSPDTIIILHPNHTGFGDLISLDPHCCWETSLGRVELDHKLGMESALPYNSEAHRNEHAAEVLLPYFQYFFQDTGFKILPVCMLDQGWRAVKHVCDQLKIAIEANPARYFIVASSDFSHYVNPEYGFSQDQFILDAIMDKNPERIISQVREKNISACGTGPIAGLCCLANSLFPNYKSDLIARGHSGEVASSDRVVDYISVLFYSEK